MVNRLFYVAIALFGLNEIALANEFKEQVKQIAQEADKLAREKAARQKSDAEEQLKLLSIMMLEEEQEPKEQVSVEQVKTETDLNQQDNEKEKEATPQNTANASESFDDDLLAKAKKLGLSDEEAKAFLKAKKNGMSDNDALLFARAKRILEEKSKLDKARSAEEERRRQIAKAEKEKFKNNELLEAGIYIPPMIESTAQHVGKFSSYEEEVSGYGVPMGTWVKGRLNRDVSSGDQGDIEIILEQDLEGKNKSIPMGTIIYAKKTFNLNTRRLSLRGSKAVTPEGDEIRSFITQAYDLQKIEGLDGVIERNREDVYQNSLWDATVEAAGSVVKGKLPIGVGSVVDSVESLEKTQGQAVPYVITVSPQLIYLRIEQRI